MSLPPISLINTVPSAMRELVRLNAVHGASTINLAGEALTWDLVDALYQLPFVEEVYNLWGPSEDTTYSSWYRCPRDRTTPCNVPIGYPVAGSEILILNKENKTLAQGEEGEICLLGEGLALGYYFNEELTQQKFIELAKDNKLKRVYKTGDLGFIDTQGVLHFKGRIDLQVKVNGFRIELEEIENNLNSLPEVLEAIATVISHQNQQQLLAGVRVRSKINEKQLIALLREKLKTHLPEYMLPHRWYLTEEFLPRTPNGKLCRKTLVFLTTETTDKLQLAEEPFAKLIFNSLGHDFDENQSYFANGGNSLAALHLLSALDEEWYHDLSLMAILNQKTPIKQLRQHLKNPKTKKLQSVTVNPDSLFASEKRMWHILKAQPNSNAYNVGMYFTLTGELDSNRLVNACQHVFAAHRTLCSNYHLGQKEIVRILRSEPIQVVQKDYSTLESSVFTLFIERIRQSLFDKPFDLEKECLLRIMLIKENETKSHFLLCAPHILVDGLALHSLMQQISLNYANPLQKIDPSNPTDLLSLEQNQLEANLERALHFWEQQYKRELPKVNWPQQKKSNESLFVRMELDAIVGKKLTAFAKSQQLSTASLCFYLFNLILYRFGLGKDLSVGYPIANRTHDLAKNLMVNLSNTLPIRTLIEEKNTLGHFIQSSYPQYLAALSHQAASIDLVLEQLQTKNTLLEGVFDILFSYMDFAINQLQLNGCTTHGDFYQQPQAKAPLVVSLIVLADEKISIRIEARGSHFDHTFIQSLSECYAHLLSNVELQWNQQLSTVEILPPAQIALIKKNLRYESFAERAPATLADWLIRSVQKYPNHVAIIDGNTKVTYEALYHQALNIVGGLKANNILPRSGIGIAMSRSWKLIAAILGVLLSGCHYVPLDRRNPKERLDYITQDACLAGVISEELIQSHVPVYLYEALSQSQPGMPELNRTSEQIAYIIYTSGTTGQPKGVPITHSNVVNLFASCQTWGHFSEHDVWTLYHSYAFDFSVWEIFGALLFGGKLIIVPEKTVSDALALIQLINEYQVTVFNQTPTAFKNILLQATELEHPPRMIIFGGEALNPSMLDSWWKIWGNSTSLINMYGITEITIHATYQEIDSKTHTSLIGKPLHHLGLVALDKNREIVPVGVVGELYVCGMGISKGYINKPELTLEKFSECAFFDLPELFYRSGDAVRLNTDGRYEYLGRLDKQIKLNGFRLEQEEIIKALNSINGVKQAEIKLINREGLDLMVAYYTSEGTLDEAQMTKQLSHILPSYAVPSLFVSLTHFPMTLNGKIDIQSLPDPEIGKRVPSNQCTTLLESPKDIVKACWKQILDIHDVDEKKPFFEHGGNSMKAIILVNQLGKVFKKEIISIIDIFRYPTIKEQTQLLISRMHGSNNHE